MNISKAEQRTLHALAQGGRIVIERDDKGDIEAVRCFTREGWVLGDCDVALFKKLKRRRLIMSQNGSPYRITREGLLRLRARADNRVTIRAW